MSTVIACRVFWTLGEETQGSISSQRDFVGFLSSFCCKRNHSNDKSIYTYLNCKITRVWGPLDDWPPLLRNSAAHFFAHLLIFIYTVIIPCPWYDVIKGITKHGRSKRSTCQSAMTKLKVTWSTADNSSWFQKIKIK